jgi:putative modified peptide
MTIPSQTEMDLLLDKLASDDDFREALLKDPATALGSIGIKVDPSLIPVIRDLPSKETVANDRLAIKGKLDGTSGAIIFIVTGNY